MQAIRDQVEHADQPAEARRPRYRHEPVWITKWPGERAQRGTIVRQLRPRQPAIAFGVPMSMGYAASPYCQCSAIKPALPPFASDYIGVDIFFVISVFLIGGILNREIRGGTFSFARFNAACRHDSAEGHSAAAERAGQRHLKDGGPKSRRCLPAALWQGQADPPARLPPRRGARGQACGHLVGRQPRGRPRRCVEGPGEAAGHRLLSVGKILLRALDRRRAPDIQVHEPCLEVRRL